MGLFTAFNARILAAIHKRSGTAQFICVALVNRQLVLTHAGGSQREVAWADLQRVIALRRDLYAGDEVSLLLEFSGSRVFEVSASCPGWPDLCAAINVLEGAKPFGEWHAKVLSIPVHKTVDVWPHGG